MHGDRTRMHETSSHGLKQQQLQHTESRNERTRCIERDETATGTTGSFFQLDLPCLCPGNLSINTIKPHAIWSRLSRNHQRFRDESRYPERLASQSSPICLHHRLDIEKFGLRVCSFNLVHSLVNLRMTCLLILTSRGSARSITSLLMLRLIVCG